MLLVLYLLLLFNHWLLVEMLLLYICFIRASFQNIQLRSLTFILKGALLSTLIDCMILLSVLVGAISSSISTVLFLVQLRFGIICWTR